MSHAPGNAGDERMQDLMPRAEKAGLLLKERRETIVIAESSTGGLISAALLAVPGASAYFLGGAVRLHEEARARAAGMEMPERHAGLDRGLCAASGAEARERFDATWALAETGATGPTGNRYGDAAGHSCIAVVGKMERAMTLETGMNERVDEHAEIRGGRARTADQNAGRD